MDVTENITDLYLHKLRDVKVAKLLQRGLAFYYFTGLCFVYTVKMYHVCKYIDNDTLA